MRIIPIKQILRQKADRELEWLMHETMSSVSLFEHHVRMLNMYRFKILLIELDNARKAVNMRDREQQ